MGLRIVKALDKILEKVSFLLSCLSAAAVISMAVVLFLDVIFRYFFNAPIRGAQDLVVLAMCVFVYTGIAQSVRSRAEITVPLVVERLSPKGQSFIKGVTSFLSCVMGGLLTSQLFVSTAAQFAKKGVGTAILKVSYAPFYLIAAVSAAVITLELLAVTVKDFAAAFSAEKKEDVQ